LAGLGAQRPLSINSPPGRVGVGVINHGLWGPAPHQKPPGGFLRGFAP